MPDDHVTTARSLYEAFGRGDVATILDAVDDDVDWEVGANDHGVPWLQPPVARRSAAATTSWP